MERKLKSEFNFTNIHPLDSMSDEQKMEFIKKLNEEFKKDMIKLTLENYSKSGLLDLKKEIDERLKQIESEVDKKKKVKKITKSKISELTAGDTILGIGFSRNVDGGIYIVDYCYCGSFSISKDPDWYSVNFSNDDYPFGISTSIEKKYINNPYCLFENCGHVEFFTLRPKTWIYDLRVAMFDRIEDEQIRFSKEMNILRGYVNTMIGDADKVDSFISTM